MAPPTNAGPSGQGSDVWDAPSSATVAATMASNTKSFLSNKESQYRQSFILIHQSINQSIIPIGLPSPHGF
jgi:hypothetical protein